MKPKISVASFALVLLSLPSAWCQEQPRNPSPVAPGELLGPQLIAWSQIQKPEPVAGSQSPQEKAQDAKAQEAPQPQPGAQSLTGTIVKDSGRYILKVAGSSVTYELDDQDRAQKYEGKQVKVAGTISAKGDSFHVISIELIS